MAADDSTQRGDGVFVATNQITCVCQYPGWIVQDKTEFPSLHRAYDTITIISKLLKCDIADYEKWHQVTTEKICLHLYSGYYGHALFAKE